MQPSGLLWFHASAVLAVGWTVISAVPATAASGAMPAARQNALVQQYCTVCHTDTVKNGGLSLEHFDAARPDPGVAAMIVSKLNGGALGASGRPLPDKSTQEALLHTMMSEAAGSEKWSVARLTDSATKASMLTASVVRGVPSTAKENAGGQDLYRLTLTCRTDTHEGEMQLAWSPGVPKQGQLLSAAADGQTPLTYEISGTEKMGNGQPGTSGPGAVAWQRPDLLHAGQRRCLCRRTVSPFAISSPTRRWSSPSMTSARKSVTSLPRASLPSNRWCKAPALRWARSGLAPGPGAHRAASCRY